ncbi:oligoribonuclease [Candidatus Saccharibacteria bacterium]|nr:oligoribonuclease [Candidatus Saccharibacteria bacterium]
MGKSAKLLWVDLEMTGLDPEKDKILEIAAITTGWDLKPQNTFEAIVKVDEEIIKTRMVGDFWEKNPDSYKSLTAQNKSGKPLKTVEQDFLSFLDANFKKDYTIILAGNSIHQDRKFIDRELPLVSERLHYRMLDVSAWKVYFEGALGKKFKKPEAHRALSDITGSIEELKYYLGMFKK